MGSSMRKGLVFLYAAALIVVLAMPGIADARKFKIGVTTIVAHPALEADQQGFEQALVDAGLEVDYDYQNAQGEMSNAQQIAQKFKNDSSIDLIHAIATPTAQAACKVIKNKPVVYSSVTDPVGAGLVSSLEAAGGPNGGNVTGVSDAWPIYEQMKLYSAMLPRVKTWGTVYNAGDANSVISINRTKQACDKLGLELV